MNEEQAVLDFFSKPENLPLGLSVATLMDGIRQRINSDFWNALKKRLDERLKSCAPHWQIQPTEDRNAADVLVGLQCKQADEQGISLFPMIEQQFLGGNWRIYTGLMWQSAPNTEQAALPVVQELKQSLQKAGFGSNESFLAWQWTRFYPRRSDFLLACSTQPETLLDEIEALLSPLLIEHRELIESANTALRNMPRSMPVSLDQLRSKR